VHDSRGVTPWRQEFVGQLGLAVNDLHTPHRLFDGVAQPDKFHIFNVLKFFMKIKSQQMLTEDYTTNPEVRTMQKNTLKEKVILFFVFFLGITTFLPIGLAYLALLTILPLLFFRVKETLFQINKFWIAILLLILIWPFFSSLSNYHDSFWQRYAHSVRIAICILVAILIAYEDRVALFKGFILGGFLAASIIILHNNFAPLPEWNIWHQLLSVKGNSSSQKWIMLATLPGILLLISLNIKNKNFMYFIWLLSFIIFLIVAHYSISRNSHIVLLTSLMAFASYHFRSPRYWIAGFLIISMIAIVSYYLSNSFNIRFNQMIKEIIVYFNSDNFDSSIGVRAHMYLVAWNTMLEYWLTGSGLGSWEGIWFEASKAYPEMSGINNPHNDFLLFGMETGLLGFLTIVLIFIRLFFISWKNKNLFAGCGWIISWGLLITTLVNAPFRDGALGMLMIILSISLSEMQQKTPNSSSSQ